jgi:hypothetical protein
MAKFERNSLAFSPGKSFNTEYSSNFHSAAIQAARQGMAFVLEQLDQKQVAVELTIAGEVRILRGAADYIRDPHLGECLRIVTGEKDGRSELLLKQSEWAGSIAVDDRHGCDYRIRLDPVCLLQ